MLVRPRVYEEFIRVDSVVDRKTIGNRVFSFWSFSFQRFERSHSRPLFFVFLLLLIEVSISSDGESIARDVVDRHRSPSIAGAWEIENFFRVFFFVCLFFSFLFPFLFSWFSWFFFLFGSNPRPKWNCRIGNDRRCSAIDERIRKKKRTRGTLCVRVLETETNGGGGGG